MLRTTTWDELPWTILQITYGYLQKKKRNKKQRNNKMDEWPIVLYISC